MLKEKRLWLDEELIRIKNSGLYRSLNTMNTAASTAVNVNGNDRIMASSNNYLGLAADPRLIDEAAMVLYDFGVGSSGSRLTTGNTIWHEKLEQRIAAFKNAEASLIFSNGYLANIGVISSLAGSRDVIISDALNHASIIDGCRLSKAALKVYDHANMADLRKNLTESMNFDKRFIITDGVFSMDGDIAPLPEIAALAKEFDATLIVDDAHATGVIGKHGKGTSEYFDLQVDVVIGTFSKAVGTEGGYVVGSKTLIEYLRNKARTFIFQTAIPPSIAAATIKALDIIESDLSLQDKLHRNITFLKDNLQKMGFFITGKDTPIIPVIIGDAETAVLFARKLEENGVYVPAIRPPTVPKGESRIRLTVMATHTEEQLEYISEVFYRIGKNLAII